MFGLVSAGYTKLVGVRRLHGKSLGEVEKVIIERRVTSANGEGDSFL